jgi:transcriptional regulator
MSSERAKPGTLDLIVLRTSQALGPLAAYAVAPRIEQQSADRLRLNQGTLYPALVRLEQQGKIKAAWRKTESNWEARFYTITRSGDKALAAEFRRWRQMSGLMEKFLPENA